jgi:hypothetical protein
MLLLWKTMAVDKRHRPQHVVAPLPGVGMSPNLKSHLGADLIRISVILFTKKEIIPVVLTTPYLNILEMQQEKKVFINYQILTRYYWLPYNIYKWKKITSNYRY